MAEIKIHIRVRKGGSGNPDLSATDLASEDSGGLGDGQRSDDDDLEALEDDENVGHDIVEGLLRDSRIRARVRKSMDPCPICAANEDPDRVKLHKNCRCEVVWEEY